MVNKSTDTPNNNRTRTYTSGARPAHQPTRTGSGAPLGGPIRKRTFGDKPRAFSAGQTSPHKKSFRGGGGGGGQRSAPTPEHRMPTAKAPALEKGNIRIIPLGGVEEIGRNMTMVEMNDQIIVIDAGIGFADEENPGIDYMIPNTRYLEENKHKIKALLITHGHLDHIGGIPYIMDRIGNPPIYTREFGALLIKAKAEDFPGLKLDIKVIEKEDGTIPISPDLKSDSMVRHTPSPTRPAPLSRRLTGTLSSPATCASITVTAYRFRRNLSNINSSKTAKSFS